ncbi:MAG: ThiF family adenylyltransferase, partial [Bacteroidota bacterium]
MNDLSWLSRTKLLIGEDSLIQLTTKHVMVVGMGGVGSFAAEFIARSGIGKMTIIDGDVVDPSNRNRQLPALATTHGQSKVQIMAERLRAINPEIELNVVQEFVNPEMVKAQLDHHPDYIIDAIDSITPKLTFISLAHQSQIPLVSSMGAGAKVDPTRLQVVD